MRHGRQRHAHGTTGMSPAMQACAEACGECHDVCLTAVQHCLQHGGQRVEPTHMTVITDCVQICEAAMDFMLRGSRGLPFARA
ncbi:hypothetical protein Mterra_00353 [Calidithermus terrae]|uniref:Ferredoxin n=1 Tax=Calidithermus terrae TaxID=1408545 RepID=A0A399F2X7_9DEIN|nr:hypothetical protein [Calidithermus terrae]RIH90558.1 hypothetical protein Mterra_00353 [Calidithermus terrae]